MDETSDLIDRARRTAAESLRARAESQQLVRASREIQQWTARVQGRVAGQAGKFYSFNRTSNALLARLPSREIDRLALRLQAVAFTRNQFVQHAGARIEHVYFPVNGLLSATMTMQEGATIELATVGSEGMAGLAASAGYDDSHHNLVVQIPGEGLRMEVEAFQAELNRGGLLRDVLVGYRRACDVQSAYQIACHGLHNATQRCCRKLLTIGDRTGSEVLPITHETLSAALGVRRSTVTEELGALQQRGAIDMERGQITIVNRRKLQSLACECYRAISREFAGLGQFATSDVLRDARPPGGQLPARLNGK